MLLERDAPLARLEALLASGRFGLAIVEGAGGIGKTAVLQELARRAAVPVRMARAAPDEPLDLVAGDPLALAPSALIVDDAQWADPATLRALGAAARRATSEPLAIVLALRPDEPGMPYELIDALRLDPRAEVVQLAPLSADAFAALGADADAHAACGGNPLYLRELRRSPGRPPAALARYVRRRLSALDPAAGDLADALAIVDDGVPVAVAAAVADLDVGEARRLAQALARMGVLIAEDPAAFAAPVVAAALRADLEPARAHALHRRAAAALVEPAAVARQLLALPAGGLADTGPLRAAAAAARDRGEPAPAIAFLRRALAEHPPPAERAGVLHELAMAEAMAADDACWAHLREAIASAPDEASRTDWTLELALGIGLLGEVRPALAAIESALDLAEDPEARDWLGVHLCLMAWGGADGSPRADALMAGYAEAPPAEPRALRFYEGIRAGRMQDPAPRVIELAIGALEGGLDAGPWVGTLMPIGALIYADAFAPARAQLDAAVAFARSRGDVPGAATAGVMRAELEYATGNLDACVRLAREHLALVAHLPGHAGAYTTAALIRALVDQGKLDEAEAALAALGAVDAVPTSHVQHFLRGARGRLHAARGRVDAALEDLAAARECLERFSRTTWSPIGFDGGELEPLLLARTGRRDAARALVDAALPRARASGPPRNLAATLRAAGRLDGDPEPLREAVGVLDGTGARLDLARTLADLGALLRRGGRRAEARPVLARAADLAADCGAGAIASLAREELAASGARPRRDRLLSGTAALTPSELRLARMAAAGRTNREIAGELFISRKTVEMHLGRAYRKLGVERREQLAAALSAAAGTR